MEIIETNLEFNSNHSAMKEVEGIVLHNSGVSVLQSIEVIHNYHKNKGWAGIGYHYYVRKDGSVYRGRPENMAGAHCPGVNSTSIGICAEGNFNEETMSEVQKQAIIELVKDIKSRYDIKWIKGHREILATSCPGDNYPFDEIVNGTVGENQTVAVDNKKECIRELQSLLNKVYNAGLAVDGIIGTHTNNALKRVALKNYCANELVKFVQRRLIMNGRGVGVYGVDGKYGKDTENAVRKFQKEKGLTIDGIAGINTIKALI